MNQEGWKGYCFNKDYWKKGFAPEAAKALVEFGFI
ncbi:MAG: GNAT family N-acetyltransferase [Firmicutes bacterium]|nr:GNAT family N-acetyltransferase [Bacillota bacterium]